MGFMRWMMERRLRTMGPENRVQMMEKMMKEFFRGMSNQQTAGLMERMMPQMMESCFSTMTPEAMMETTHNMVPRMMESCFSKMNLEERKRMLEMCRETLHGIEARYQQ